MERITKSMIESIIGATLLLLSISVLPVKAEAPAEPVDQESSSTSIQTVTPESLAERYSMVVETLKPPEKRFIPDDTLRALEKATSAVKCAVTVEVGHSIGKYAAWDPYAVGGEGEEGIGQLHPQGKLPTFLAAGYTNPNDPDQVVDFMNKQFALGDANHWAGYYPNGVCW